MSKNTSSSLFRKLDVDQLNNEDLFEEQVEPQSPTGLDENEVKGLLQQSKYGEALRHVLSHCPLHSKNQMIKDAAFNLTMQIMLNVRASEIDKVLDLLNMDQIDVLMKYIYRGFESPSEGSSAQLLVWHEKTYNRGGVGSIVRVLTDKKRV